MEKIPVTFNHNGKTVTGYLDAGHPSGHSWTLMVNRYVWGFITFYPAFGDVRFHWNEKGMEIHEDYFYDLIIAAVQ